MIGRQNGSARRAALHAIENSNEGNRKRVGGGVRLTLLGDETVRGFNASVLKQMLARSTRRGSV